MKEFANNSKGVNRDVHLDNLDNTSFAFILNATIEDSTGNNFHVANEASNLLLTLFEKGEQIIGSKAIYEMNLVLLSTVQGNICRFRLLEGLNFIDRNANYKSACSLIEQIPLEKQELKPLISTSVLVESDKLGWKIQNRLDIEYKITDCSLNIYFREGDSPTRFIYFDLNPLKLSDDFKVEQGQDGCGNNLVIDVLDVDKTNWYSEIKAPCAEIKEISGGKLKAGVYQVLTAYATSKGQALTSYPTSTNPLPISTRRITEEVDYDTSKALSITVSNISDKSRYNFLNIVVVETVNGFSERKLVATLPITGSTLNYIYTGTEEAVKLDTNSLFQVYPFYKSAKNLALANNFLFQAGLTEFSKINVQRIALKLQGKLRWFTVTLKEGDYMDSSIAENFKGYWRDEVYAFGIQFYLGRGEWTVAAHIPSRAFRAGEKDLITSGAQANDVIQGDSCTPVQRELWQIKNTANIVNTYALRYDKCNPQIFQEGEFAYYESTDHYPTNGEVFGELCNKPILHHKFPDSTITHIHDGALTKAYGDANYIFPMGVKLAPEIDIQTVLQECLQEGIITEEEKNSIHGYRIVRGNRIGHESIQARGLLYDVWYYNNEGQKVFYPNYPFNDLRTDPLLVNPVKINGVEIVIKPLSNQNFAPTRKYTFHSPDTSFVQPALGNTLKLETEEFGTAEGFFNKAQDQAEQKLLSVSQYNLAIILGTILGEAVEFKDGAVGQAQTIGQTVGGAVGTAIAPGIGTALGSIAGGLIGGAISDNNNMEDFWRANTIIGQIEKILQLFKLIAQYENYSWQYQAVGKYNNYKPITQVGNKQRTILTSVYLNSGRKTIPLKEGGSVLFNNWNRESSVFLEINTDLPKPTVEDTSRFIVGHLPDPSAYKENQVVYSNISSYYATIKADRLNQYGTVFDIKYLPVSCAVYQLDQKASLFGGDMFIGRTAEKRKHSFFTRSLFKEPNDTNILYSDYPNVATPRYFFDTIPNRNPIFNLSGTGDSLVDMIVNSLNTGTLPTDIIQTVTSVPKKAKWWLLLIPAVGGPLYVQSVMDAKVWKNYIKNIGAFFRGTLLNPFNFFKAPDYFLDTYVDSYEKDSKRFNSNAVTGKMYLYYYGIPYYITESSINLDLRHGGLTPAKDFYPNQQDLRVWLQEKNVSPSEDNYFFYNTDYSKQNKEQIIPKYDVNYSPDDACKIHHPNRVIYSLQGSDVENNDFRDPYLFNKALDFHDFDYKNGKLISINSIENSKILVRFENRSQLFSAYTTIQTDQATAIISNGDLFKSRPQEYIITDEGYLGSQHQDMLSTPFGHVFTDVKRGNIFLLSPDGGQPSEISNKGLKNWFKENLPFTISKYFDIETDNPYAGVGITMVFDKRYNRMFLTKLDYEPIVKGIAYLKNENLFTYNGIPISLYDYRYFRNKSFTVGYNFYSQMWSYYSFTPNYYIGGINTFITGLNSLSNKQSSAWIHNTTNKSFQVFYGKLHPFTVEVKTKGGLPTKKLAGIEYLADVIRFHNKYDAFYSRENPFNELIVYTEFLNTGKLKLVENQKNNHVMIVQYPKRKLNEIEVLVDNKENKFAVNTLYNAVKCDAVNIPIWLYASNNVNKHLNLASLEYVNFKPNTGYIEGNVIFARFTNTAESNKKIIFKGAIFNGIDYTNG